MTIVFLTTSLILICSYYLYKEIHKYNLYIYAVVALIVLIFLNTEANIVTMGFIGYSFMLVVMFTGTLSKGTMRKRLSMVRAELAIIGYLLIVPHAFGYLSFVLEYVGLFNAPLQYYIGILAFWVAAPLFVTSFQFIRRKMTFKTWKKIHRFSYLFWSLVALHVILLQNDRMWLYIAIYVVYTISRLQLVFQKKRIAQSK